MYTTVINKLRWSYRKNWPDIYGILARHYPEFVFKGTEAALGDEIPVFVFHSVRPLEFEQQLRYLHENGYRTLRAEELLAVLAQGEPAPPRSVVLTFDDGTASLYSVAWPLLRKYGFTAISFLIPGCIPEQAPAMPAWSDYEQGVVSEAALLEREQGAYPLCSWQEIAEMHESGVIDFEAHTMYHHLIHVSPQLVDFIHPNYDFYFYANIHVPVYYSKGQPDYSRNVPFGTPVYRAEPRFSGYSQYFDNEDVRQACVDHVRENGGEAFFLRKNWRKQLQRVQRRATQRFGPGEYETIAETEAALVDDLSACKSAIEAHLPGKKVKHFCFPWFIGSRQAVRAAQAVGFQALYWGILRDRRTNRPGDDPLHIMRLEDRFIFTLPGTGRKTFTDVIKDKFVRYMPIFSKRLQSAL